MGSDVADDHQGAEIEARLRRLQRARGVGARVNLPPRPLCPSLYSPHLPSTPRCCSCQMTHQCHYIVTMATAARSPAHSVTHPTPSLSLQGLQVSANSVSPAEGVATLPLF